MTESPSRPGVAILLIRKVGSSSEPLVVATSHWHPARVLFDVAPPIFAKSHR
jgi:hypothetical protein